jgi:hypothetical protein
MPPQEFLEKYSYLNPEDIADGVVYVLGTPPHVQVCQNSACHLWQVVRILDIRYRSRPSLSNWGGGEEHSFRLTALSWRWKDKVLSTCCCVCTTSHGILSQKMATIKCNFIYTRTLAYIHEYIHNTLTVWRYKILFTMKLLLHPVPYLTTCDVLCSPFFTGMGVVYNTKWANFMNSSANISYVRMTPYWPPDTRLHTDQQFAYIILFHEFSFLNFRQIIEVTKMYLILQKLLIKNIKFIETWMCHVKLHRKVCGNKILSLSVRTG